jgi:hypothetical protein
MTDAVWRRSSYSGTNGNCVEFHPNLNAVRDSKSPDAVLKAGRDVIDRLITAVKEGRIGLR